MNPLPCGKYGRSGNQPRGRAAHTGRRPSARRCARCTRSLSVAIASAAHPAGPDRREAPARTPSGSRGTRTPPRTCRERQPDHEPQHLPGLTAAHRHTRSVQSSLDVMTLLRDEAADRLGLNEIGRVRLRTTAPQIAGKPPQPPDRGLHPGRRVDEPHGLRRHDHEANRPGVLPSQTGPSLAPSLCCDLAPTEGASPWPRRGRRDEGGVACGPRHGRRVVPSPRRRLLW